MFHTLIFATIAVLMQPCGPQSFRHMDDVDPNKVAIDPVSGQRLLRSVVSAKLGDTVTFTVHACDADGDSMMAWREDSGLQLPIDPNSGDFSFSMISPAEANDVYLDIGLTDGTDTRRGTYVVKWRVNSAPVLENDRVIGGVDIARLQQKMLMTWFKWTGMPLSNGFVFVKETD